MPNKAGRTMVVKKNVFPQESYPELEEEKTDEIKNSVQMKSVKTEGPLMKVVKMKTVTIFPVKMNKVGIL
jgi:hypothetical protein